MYKIAVISCDCGVCFCDLRVGSSTTIANRTRTTTIASKRLSVTPVLLSSLSSSQPVETKATSRECALSMCETMNQRKGVVVVMATMSVRCCRQDGEEWDSEEERRLCSAWISNRAKDDASQNAIKSGLAYSASLPPTSSPSSFTLTTTSLHITRISR